MRTLVRTMSIVQNFVKTLSDENPNKPRAIGTLEIDDDAVTTGLQGETQVTTFDQIAQ